MYVNAPKNVDSNAPIHDLNHPKRVFSQKVHHRRNLCFTGSHLQSPVEERRTGVPDTPRIPLSTSDMCGAGDNLCRSAAGARAELLQFPMANEANLRTCQACSWPGGAGAGRRGQPLPLRGQGRGAGDGAHARRGRLPDHGRSGVCSIIGTRALSLCGEPKQSFLRFF